MTTNHPMAQEIGNGPIICFVALPLGDQETFRYKSVLLPALRMVLERHPYFWQVSCAADKVYSGFVYDNVGEWLKRAHVYIADISDLNYNVMMEFGYMLWAKKPGQPLIVLERNASIANLPEYKELADIQGLIRTRYTPDPALYDAKLREYAKNELEQRFTNIFLQIPALQEMRRVPSQHYLSPVWIEEECKYNDKNMTRAISTKYITMEAFKDAIKGTNERITTKRAKAAANELSPWKVSADVLRSILHAVLAVLEEGRE